jgi:hypothetical protein
MIFDCGETDAAYVMRLKNWHDFFPLFPRTVDRVDGRNVCAWLETIQRRGVWVPLCGWHWIYRIKP